MTRLCIALFGYDNAQTILTRPIAGVRWYMAQDICRLLGIRNYSNAVNKPCSNQSFTLTSADRRYYSTSTTPRTSKRTLLMVNATGMYKLIMRANPTVAREIQERATSLMARGEFR